MSAAETQSPQPAERRSPQPAERRFQKRVRVVILGAGMSGLCMAIQLKQRGIESFLVLEKADRVGGTWRENTYPGVACDVPSHLYSFSFELNPNWSRNFSPGHEIQQYCERCVTKYGLAPYLRFGAQVAKAAYANGVWTVETSDGMSLTADVVVSALGGLHVPNVPDFEGLADFRGEFFHSAQWRHDVSLAGKKVAVIGTGASAVQIVPEIAPDVAQLTLFQRTPGWVVPRNDTAFSEETKARMRRFPALPRALRWILYWVLEVRGRFVKRGSYIGRLIDRQARAYLEKAIPDRVLRERVTPEFIIGCKRLMVSDDYYPALQRDNVEVVTEGVRRISADGIETTTGRLIDCDVIVAATGFRPFDITSFVDIRGRNGVSLAHTWQERTQAHRTLMVSDFPNLFLLLGPNSGLGHNSVILMIEAQVRFVIKTLALMERRSIRSIDPTPGAERRFNERLQRDLESTVFSGGCNAWYTDDKDQNFTLWPHSTLRYFVSLLAPRLAEYRVRGR